MVRLQHPSIRYGQIQQKITKDIELNNTINQLDILHTCTLLLIQQKQNTHCSQAHIELLPTQVMDQKHTLALLKVQKLCNI